MKNMLLSICVLIALAGCKKHTDVQTSAPAHEFKGIVVINEAGDELGTCLLYTSPSPRD